MIGSSHIVTMAYQNYKRKYDIWSKVKKYEIWSNVAIKKAVYNFGWFQQQMNSFISVLP